jgi:tRNA uridine 5-carboxymethylaminomethyl modification enzyme
LKRPGVAATDLVALEGSEPLSRNGAGHQSPPGEEPWTLNDALAAVEVELKYRGYVVREMERARKLRDQATFELGRQVPYSAFATLTVEARQKLGSILPETLAHAARIPGVSPADLQNLVMEVRRWRGAGPEGP